MLSRLVRAFVLLPAVAAAVLSSPMGLRAQTKPATPAPQGGVHVSGYWKLDVKNADGSVARHVEFENALQGTGMTSLVQYLSSTAVSGGINIVANDGANGGPCNYGGCLMYVSGTGTPNYSNSPGIGSSLAGTVCNPAFVAGVQVANPGYSCFSTLTSSTSGATVTLLGSITADKAGKISQVSTTTSTCTSGTATQCTANVGGFGPVLTAATLTGANVITLAQGQLLQFSVVLTFS